MWDGMKRLAGDGINAVIALPNAGIDGINKLISDFGGSKEAISKIPKVKFAGGTGMFSSYRNPITKTTLATLNDGYDSPETNNQEMVILPNGKSFLPQGRNVEYLLPAGSEVINASELAMLMGVERGAFAKGTGFWSKIWDTATNVAGSVWDTIKNGVDKFMKMIEFVTDVVKDPVGSLAKKFSPNADKLAGMFNPLGNALYKNQLKKLRTGGKNFGLWLTLRWMKVQWRWVLKVMTTDLKTKLKMLVPTRGVTSIVNVYHSLPAAWQTLALNLACLVTLAMVINGYLPVCHT